MDNLEKQVKVNRNRIIIGILITTIIATIVIFFIIINAERNYLYLESNYSDLKSEYSLLENENNNTLRENTNLRFANQSLRLENDKLIGENATLKTEAVQANQPHVTQPNNNSSVDANVQNVGAGVDFQNNNSSVDTNVQNVGTRVDFQITVERLMDEFDTNSLRAEAKYKNKTLAVTGIVGDIRRSAFVSRPLVTLKGSTNPFLDFGAHFREMDLQSLANLKTGQKVTIIGTLTSQFRLENCSIR